MADIFVNQISHNQGDYVFEVVVGGSGSKTRHSVTMTEEFYRSLSTKSSPTDIIKKSFAFLLQKEDKESILKEFDIKVISRYFPEFEKESKNF